MECNVLGLWVYCEIVKALQGQASKYEPLISILPAHHDCTLAWDTSDSAYLKGEKYVYMHSFDTGNLAGNDLLLQARKDVQCALKPLTMQERCSP